MGLWYYCGSGFVRTTLARSNLGLDVYLCCPGPSLANVDDSKFHVPGIMLAAINTAYPKVRPDIWFGMDTARCYDRQLWKEPFVKICRGGYQEMTIEGFPVKLCPNVYFADFKSMEYVGDMFKIRNHDAIFSWNSNTLTAALGVLVWMGAKNIHLVGCDFGGKNDYWDDRVLSEPKRVKNQLLYQKQITFMRDLQHAARMHNIRFISCTPDSPVNMFLDYMPLEDAIAKSVAKVNLQKKELLHVLDALKCEWRNGILAEQGVMVGVAPVHEDIIPWWIQNYKAHNNYPLVFADFGLTEKGKKLCKEHGQLIDMGDLDNVQGWFRKPFAILRAPFKKILWFDVDVEIRGDIGKLFDYACDGKIGAGHDSYEPASFRRYMKKEAKLWDSGVLAIEHKNLLVETWCERIMVAPEDFYVGDHEVLSLVLWDNNMPLNEIPKNVHRMRTEGDVSGLLTMHWTGPAGKKWIRKMARKQNEQKV